MKFVSKLVNKVAKQLDPRTKVAMGFLSAGVVEAVQAIPVIGEKVISGDTLTRNQWGTAIDMFGTRLWLVKLLREEYADSPVINIPVSTLTPVFVKEDQERIDRADLNYPIYITKAPCGNYIIIDGNHRAAKAQAIDTNGTIKAIVIQWDSFHMEKGILGATIGTGKK